MEITPPYYQRHHTLVYIFKKIGSEKATFDFFMKYDMKIFICFSRATTSIPTNTKPTLSGCLKEKISLKKRSPQYLLSSQSYVLFITCLPKTGKERNKLKNWRPISLLNTSYKLISLCITNRIRPLLHSIISPEQKGFIEGRSISECTRLMLDIIHECEAQNKAGLILLVDFEKAFDSLSWNFIHEILPKFNFGENFIKWIHMFQQNSKARVILKGHLSEPFLLHRGCRQGDPISPYIFILCAEYLALAFKKEENFKGIKLLNKDHRLSLYADDTSIFMEASDENLDMSLKILEWFYMKSGLKINYTKTKVIRIGSIRETDRRFGRENALDWVHEFTALGIDYNMLDIKNITKTNIESKIESMKCITKAWGCRNITPVGRITVLKSLVLSKITHVLLSLPTPCTETLTIIDDLCYKFIWKGRHKVSKSTLCKDFNDGGLKMLNMKEFDKSLKITWIRKLLTTNPDWEEFAIYYKIDRLTLTDINYHKQIKNFIKNPFWKDVATAYTEWYASFKTVTEISTEFQPIWGNPTLNLPFNPTWYKGGIHHLKDMYKEDGNLLEKHELERLLQTGVYFTQYYAFRYSLPREWANEMTNY